MEPAYLEFETHSLASHALLMIYTVDEATLKSMGVNMKFLKGINQQTLPIAIFFLRCCCILRKFCLQKIAISRLQAARLKLNGIWTTGGYSGIAQTVLVAMPTVCPPLQIEALQLSDATGGYSGMLQWHLGSCLLANHICNGHHLHHLGETIQRQRSEAIQAHDLK